MKLSGGRSELSDDLNELVRDPGERSEIEPKFRLRFVERSILLAQFGFAQKTQSSAKAQRDTHLCSCSVSCSNRMRCSFHISGIEWVP